MSLASALLRVVGRPLATGIAMVPGLRVRRHRVLGAPLRPDGGLTAVLKERVDAGVMLWRARAAPVIVASGGLARAGATLAEADGMAAALRAAGVPEEAVIIERQSRTTAENATRVAELLLPCAADAALIVSQPFHLRRACWLFSPRRLRVGGLAHRRQRAVRAAAARLSLGRA